MKNKWIFDQEIKRWHTPEEFKEVQERLKGGASNGLAKFQVRDTLDGIAAADLHIKSINDRNLF